MSPAAASAEPPRPSMLLAAMELTTSELAAQLAAPATQLESSNSASIAGPEPPLSALEATVF